MEPHRDWHDPVVEIYGNLITPGVRCSAQAYDLANRRWYRLDVETVVEDWDWLAAVVAKHLRQHHAQHGAAPPWNTVKTDSQETETTFDILPACSVGRDITETISYGANPTDKLSTTPVDTLKELTYISRSTDRCTWEDQECVFKRIEFDVDVEVIQGASGRDQRRDGAPVLLGAILAVVTATRPPWIPGTVAGFLTPYGGPDLEMLVRDHQALHVTRAQLTDLVRGVSELVRADVQHGDIKYWNAVRAAPDAPLMLIDAGTLAPDYPGDAPALDALLGWCLENAPALRCDDGEARKVREAAAALDRSDFDAALACLSTEGDGQG